MAKRDGVFDCGHLPFEVPRNHDDRACLQEQDDKEWEDIVHDVFLLADDEGD
jgi:hypothetical protein